MGERHLYLLFESGDVAEACVTTTIFQRRPLAPLTGGTASGSWPTPESSDASGGRVSKEMGGTRPSGAKRAVTLGTAVAHRFPTPNARDWKDTGPNERERWATPTKSDGTGDPGNSGRDGGENLRTQVGGSLNPRFVEWLQGFPMGWTEVE